MTKNHKFGSAVKWAYAMTWGEKGFSALFAFILASILGPRDFGVIAMAMVYISFIQMFLDQGLITALIQRKDLQQEHLDAVFWMDMAGSLLLIAVTLGFGRWWSAANHLPELAQVILALSLIVPIEGLSIVQRAILQREMDFKSLSLRSNVSVLIGGFVGLGMAFKGFGVWALVGQRVIQDVVALGLLWSLSHWRPRWRFSFKHFKELLSFSTASFMAKLAVFGSQQSDALLMGFLFGPAAVGLYRLADRLMNLVVDGATNSLQVVSVSQFSRLQDNSNELRKSVLACLRISSRMTFPILGLLAVVSGPLMGILGAKWAATADVLKILCMVGMVSALTNFTGPLVMSVSRPYLMAALEWIKTTTGVALLVVAAVYLKGASVSEQVIGIATTRFVLGVLIFAPVFLFVLMRFCKLSVRDIIDVVFPPACSAAAIVLVVAVVSVSGILGSLRRELVLAANVAIGSLAGLGTLLAIDSPLRSVFCVWITTTRRRLAYANGVDPAAPEDRAIGS